MTKLDARAGLQYKKTELETSPNIIMISYILKLYHIKWSIDMHKYYYYHYWWYMYWITTHSG